MLWRFVKVEPIKSDPADRTEVRPCGDLDGGIHLAPSFSSIRKEQEADDEGAMAIERSLDANLGRNPPNKDSNRSTVN